VKKRAELCHSLEAIIEPLIHEHLSLSISKELSRDYKKMNEEHMWFPILENELHPLVGARMTW
jgi:hypothetical protein